ncbi:protein halfway isoform X2 [Onthophagus taurus]|uniref:protein halfway isoform X2 n=1 Tax=Onthophagus taurus TaxID=166361 RepID=UPI000C20E516|nr:protein halfway isoform X2 [Onthophagus taurus]
MFRLIFILVLLNFVLVNCKNCDEHCFSDSSKPCEKVNEPKCFISTICQNAVVCCRLNDNLDEYLVSDNITFSTKNINYLHILNSNFNNFTLSMSKWLKNLKSLAVTNGRLKQFNPILKKMSPLECLNLSSNSLTTVGSLKYAGKLRTLDLSNNSLPDIPDEIPQTSPNIKIDISDNQLSCDNLSKGLKSSKYKNLDFENPNNTWCILTKNKQIWIDYPGRLSLSALEKLSENQTNCAIPNCKCGIHRVDTSNSKLWTTVDCSNAKLQELPKLLPENCFSLNVSYNNISSLKGIHNPSYDSLSELDAQHNLITSIDDLEGSKFIDNFRRLDLRNNSITSISTHPFRFDRASQKELSLGYNYIECDCNVAKTLKEWLRINDKDIKDKEEVFCKGKLGKVIDLDPSELCRKDPSLTDYIYYIIAAEVLLLTLLIAKVSYDYWVFKGTGYLPWPASKMPKLPCDWLCE